MLRTVKNAEVMQFRPVLGAREGKGEVAIFDCVLFVRDARESMGYIAILPSFGHLRRQTSGHHF